MTGEVLCYVCKSPGTELLLIKDKFKIQKCNSCGHGWVINVPSAEELKRFYESEQAVSEQYEFSEKVIRKHARRLLRWIAQVKTPPGFMLDIGCGRGVHLKVAEKNGWKTAGVDFSEASKKICAEQGVSIYRSILEVREKYGNGMFDVATLWEVIEHAPNPRALLLEVKNVLKKDGVLALSTPNFKSVIAQINYSLWQEIRPPLHLHYFTPESLRSLLEQSGFYTINQLTFASWNAGVDAIGEKLGGWLGLPPTGKLLRKTLFYKLLKGYFNSYLHSKMEGLGLLNLSSPERRQESLKLKKFFES